MHTRTAVGQKAWPIIIILLLGGLGLGCQAPAAPAAEASSAPAPSGYSVHGLQPGLSGQQVKALLGEPVTEGQDVEGHQTLEFSRGPATLQVTLEPSGRVLSVTGVTLEKDGRPLARVGDAQAAVLQALSGEEVESGNEGLLRVFGEGTEARLVLQQERVASISLHPRGEAYRLVVTPTPP